MSTNGGEGLSPRYAHQLGVPLPGVTIWGVISGEEGYLRHSDSSQPIYCISSSAERLSNKVIQRKLRHFEHWIRHVCHLSLQTDIAMDMTQGSRGKGIRRWCTAGVDEARFADEWSSDRKFDSISSTIRDAHTLAVLVGCRVISSPAED